MTIEILIVLGVLAGVLAMLATTRIAADAIMVAALTVLLAIPFPKDGVWRLGVLTIDEGFSGFSNTGMLTVGVLFVVVAGLKETGAIDWIASRLLGRPKSERGAMVRVMLPVWGMSAFLNNTPVVAMMIPAVQDWAKKLRISPSRLLLPLSYSAILGGTCSLIGTSTNLVVAGLVLSQTDLAPLTMFGITKVGLPTALVCGLFLVLIGPKLLPRRSSASRALSDPKEYTLELVVPEGSPMTGKTVDEAGLRSLPGCFLIEIDRADEVIAPVGPQQTLREGDRLLFAGVVDSIRDLVNTRGLSVATNQVFKLDSPRYRRRLYEVVVAPSCSLTGRTIRASKFRNRYNGAVIAVARNGERIRGKIGDIELQGGDLLLVEADSGFAERAGNARDFLLVSSLENSTPKRHSRAPLAVAILIGMVGLATFEVFPMLLAGLIASGVMILSRCCTLTEARRSVDWSVLIVIGAALGIGKAMDKSGSALLIADTVLSVVGNNPWIVLLAIYAVTSFMTEIISNNAAVALMFPIGQAAAQTLGVDFMPFVIGIMMAGSASFATPIGYQTNLMVYGPGGYNFRDFLRIGVPMNLTAGTCGVILTPLMFPF
jgi:di/tricarboxylate transporter